MATHLFRTNAGQQAAVAPPEMQTAGPETEELARLAYQYWLERRSPIGAPVEDWLRAVEEITRRQERLKQARVAG